MEIRLQQTRSSESTLLQNELFEHHTGTTTVVKWVLQSLRMTSHGSEAGTESVKQKMQKGNQFLRNIPGEKKKSLSKFLLKQSFIDHVLCIQEAIKSGNHNSLKLLYLQMKTYLEEVIWLKPCGRLTAEMELESRSPDS